MVCAFCDKELNRRYCIECSEVPSYGCSTITDIETGKSYAVMDRRYCSLTCLFEHISYVLLGISVERKF